MIFSIQILDFQFFIGLTYIENVIDIRITSLINIINQKRIKKKDKRKEYNEYIIQVAAEPVIISSDIPIVDHIPDLMTKKCNPVWSSRDPSHHGRGFWSRLD